MPTAGIYEYNIYATTPPPHQVMRCTPSNLASLVFSLKKGVNLYPLQKQLGRALWNEWLSLS